MELNLAKLSNEELQELCNSYHKIAEICNGYKPLKLRDMCEEALNAKLCEIRCFQQIAKNAKNSLIYQTCANLSEKIENRED